MIHLPAIRRLLKPDPNYVLIDADLDRAEAQVVAWEANEPELKRIFQTGADVHMDNAILIYGPKATRANREQAKAGVHLTDYAGKARTLGSTLGVTTAKAEEFQKYWFKRFPGIREWHRRTDHNIRLTRCVYNSWGFRRFYFDRIASTGTGEFSELLPQASAWIAQSTVAITINQARKNIDCARQFVNKPRCGICLACRRPGSIVGLLQVHDSLLMQSPERFCPEIFADIQEAMKVQIPFGDPLIIPTSMKFSRESWGKVDVWKDIKDAA